jgi:membrane-bound inhibitor of C-type lysozyme
MRITGAGGPLLAPKTTEAKIDPKAIEPLKPMNSPARTNRNQSRENMIGNGTTKKYIKWQALAPVVSALLSGCSSVDVEKRQWLSFRCPDDRRVMAQLDPQDDSATVRFAGREWRLPHVISGSGARYSDGKVTFWNKGKSALVQVDDKIMVQDCVLE